jgi:tetratricopeptide (TPR) repeat protein
MRQSASRRADYPYRIASAQLPLQPSQALATLREAMRTSPAESLTVAGSAGRLTALLAASNVAMATGALDDMDRVLTIAETVDPTLPGTLRAGRPAPTAMATGPIRLGVRAAAGVASARDRRSVDSAIAFIEQLPEPAGTAARREAWGIAYAAFVSTGDVKYVTVMTAGPNDFDDPFTRAEVLAALGQRRRAIATLETIEPASFEVLDVDPRWAMYPRSLLERALLYEQEGEREQALRAYDRFLTLMKDADAAFQPQLQLARTRVNALRDAPGATLRPSRQ